MVGLCGAALGAERALWVRTPKTQVLAAPKGSAKVKGTLPVGAEVRWLGAAPGAPGFHRVRCEKPALEGFVLQTSLATRPLAEETLASGANAEKLKPEAFASSGAATKAVSEGGKRYAQAKNRAEALAQLEALEAVVKSIGPKDVAAHGAAAGLPQPGAKR